MTQPKKPNRTPLYAAIVAIIILAGALAAVYLQVADLQNRVNNLQTQVNKLQNQIIQLNGIINLQNTTELFSGSVGPIPSGGISTQSLREFAYAGYLKISYNSTGAVHLEIDCQSSGSTASTQTPIQTAATNIQVPVVPNSACSVNYWNDAASPVTVTVLINFVY